MDERHVFTDLNDAQGHIEFLEDVGVNECYLFPLFAGPKVDLSSHIEELIRASQVENAEGSEGPGIEAEEKAVRLKGRKDRSRGAVRETGRQSDAV